MAVFASLRFIAIAGAFLMLVGFGGTAPRTLPREAAKLLPHGQIDERETHQCTIEGNSDLYGLGIRLGVYFQWLSAIITPRLTSSNFAGLLKSFLSFIFAIFIAILVLTAQSASTHPCEVLILQYIVFGGLFIFNGIGGKPGRQIQMKMTGLLGLIFVGESVAMAAYSSWFWLAGLRGSFLDRSGCHSYGFLFVKVDLYRPAVSHAFAALSIIYCVWMTLLLAIICFMIVRAVVWCFFSKDKVKRAVARIFLKAYARFLIVHDSWMSAGTAKPPTTW